MMGIPGSYAAPVANPAVFPGLAITVPPADWITTCGTPAPALDTSVYYEIRGRSVPMGPVSGQTGFVPRMRLGGYLSIVALQNANGSAFQANTIAQIPYASVSASLAPPVGPNGLIWNDFSIAFPDPSYGPVLRIWNQASLHGAFERSDFSPLYLVSVGLAETKDEDFETSGHF